MSSSTEWRRKNPEKAKEQRRRYWERNKDRQRKLNREGQVRRREQRKAAKLAQAGRPPPPVCELCGEFHLRIVWDHCHTTGRFRGWLCDRCNKVLGMVYDSPTLLAKLANYLTDHDE